MISLNDNNRDDYVDENLLRYTVQECPVSFFLCAGAGSGKTKSLVKLLDNIKKVKGEEYKRKGKKIAVITYTNAACDEIIRRTGYDSLFEISTIHRFSWNLIKNYQDDIRYWLKNNIKSEIDELEEAQLKSRTQKSYNENDRKILSKKRRLESLDKIRYFVYNPNGENISIDSLNHDEVIKISNYFIKEYELMQKILICKFPILLIDECQDTKKKLMESIILLQKNNNREFCVGLFGDMMQRIYPDGKSDLDRALPDDWEMPIKVMNHRSSKRIVELVNKVRLDVDKIQQKPRDDSYKGHVKLFVADSTTKNKRKIEELVMNKMINYTGDKEWKNKDNGCQKLILEHRMIAERIGFIDLYNVLHKKYNTNFLDGTLVELNFFANIILPIIESKKDKDELKLMNLIKDKSPLLENEVDKSKYIENLNIISNEIDIISEKISSNTDTTCFDIVSSISNSGILNIPEKIKLALNSLINNDESEDDIIEIWKKMLYLPFNQIINYKSYISGASGFGTHQGVKGLEFPRVLMILDDYSAVGNMFSYEKLFGVKKRTKTDIDNEKAGKDNAIDRSRRLFYVGCSRAEKSLAILVYSDNPGGVKDYAISKGWFENNEIEIL
ncbi:MAG: ATP-dependent helicase [Paeniclostridium sordellii]|nr:ATP-dependent helicase [Paeniclostridium sordellii]